LTPPGEDILYGTTDGKIGLLKIGESSALSQWEIDNDMKTNLSQRLTQGALVAALCASVTGCGGVVTPGGQNAGVHQEPWTPESSDIATVCPDPIGRRMITSSFKNDVVMRNYNNGMVLAELKLTEATSLVTNIIFCHITGRGMLARAGWDKTIAVFTEVEPGCFELYRTFKGHTGDISALVGYPTGLASGSVNGEICSWSLDSSAPVAVVRLATTDCVECMAHQNSCVFVGDSSGSLHVFQLPKLQALASLKAHCLTAKHALSTLGLDPDNGTLYTADTLGYVRRWGIEYSPAFALTPGEMERCHADEITGLVVVDGGRYLVTSGVDMIVRLCEAFGLVGLFSTESQ